MTLLESSSLGFLLVITLEMSNNLRLLMTRSIFSQYFEIILNFKIFFHDGPLIEEYTSGSSIQPLTINTNHFTMTIYTHIILEYIELFGPKSYRGKCYERAFSGKSTRGKYYERAFLHEIIGESETFLLE